ncbi:MAG: zinc-binding dehydrogenase [Candidatus Caldarchaeum sp.]|nr:zinc-binding dehydrogenase [Candidatus Caldarchaeum sp.]
MRAAVAYKPFDLVVRDDVEIPKPAPHEILVRVRSVGVCPNDVRFYTGESLHKQIPYGENSYGLPGHEWAGEVVEVGSKVDGLQVGDYVAPDHLIPCNNCRYCRLGFTNICVNKSHYLRAYAEYATAHGSYSYKFPKNIKFDEACLAEPLSTVINASRIADIRAGDIVLVVGAGPMGLLHTMLAKQSGATVIVSEVIKERVEAAKKFGAEVAADPSSDDLAKSIKEMTDGVGVDKIIVSIGNPVAIEQHMKYVRKRGVVVIFGGVVPPRNISVDPNQLHYHEVFLTGSFDHTGEDFRKAVKLISQRKLALDNLISHRFPLNEIVQAFETSKSKSGLKVVVNI